MTVTRGRETYTYARSRKTTRVRSKTATTYVDQQQQQQPPYPEQEQEQQQSKLEQERVGPATMSNNSQKLPTTERVIKSEYDETLLPIFSWNRVVFLSPSFNDRPFFSPYALCPELHPHPLSLNIAGSPGRCVFRHYYRRRTPAPDVCDIRLKLMRMTSCRTFPDKVTAATIVRSPFVPSLTGRTVLASVRLYDTKTTISGDLNSFFTRVTNFTIPKNAQITWILQRDVYEYHEISKINMHLHAYYYLLRTTRFEIGTLFELPLTFRIVSTVNLKSIGFTVICILKNL